MTPAERLLDEESSYAAVADELNDGEPGDATLDDLDPEVVASARTYAERNELSWPPEVGDFDRWCEADRERRRKVVVEKD